MMRGITFILFFVFILSSLFIGQGVYNSEIERGEEIDIYNITNNLNVNFSCNQLYDNSYNLYTPEFKVKRINKIVCSFADFIITAGTETVKFGVEFGYENPKYNYEFYFKLIKLYIIALIFVAIIPIIIPLIALIYLLFIGIKNLINKINNRHPGCI